MFCSLYLFTTHRQLGYWSSNYDLWTHALAVTDRNFIAQNNLGGALLLLGKPDEAYPHFQAAAEINPNDPMSHSNLGAYLQEHGKLTEAIEQYDRTISLTSDAGLLAATYANLGTAYRKLGEDEKARESYDQALRLNPNQSNAYLGLGQLLEKQNQLDDAIRQLFEIGRAAPDRYRIHASGACSRERGPPPGSTGRLPGRLQALTRT